MLGIDHALFPLRVSQRFLEDVAALADAARRLPELEREVITRLREMDAGLREMRSTVAALAPVAGDVHEMHAALGRLDQGLPATLDPMAGRVQEIHAALGRLDQGLSATLDPMAGRVQEIHAALGRLDEGLPATLDPMAGRVEGILATLNQLDARIGALAPLVKSLAVDVEDATDRLPEPSGPGLVERAKAFASPD